jgi:hypothetical protein
MNPADCDMEENRKGAEAVSFCFETAKHKILEYWN